MVCPAPLLPRGCQSTLRHRADGNVAAVSHGQHVLTPTAAAAWCANTAVSKAAWWPWPFDLESGVRVMCDVGYLCLSRPLCSLLKPDVCDRRQTDVRQKHHLMPCLLRVGHNKRFWCEVLRARCHSWCQQTEIHMLGFTFSASTMCPEGGRSVTVTPMLQLAKLMHK